MAIRCRRDSTVVVVGHLFLFFGGGVESEVESGVVGDTCRGMRALREFAQRRHMRVSIYTINSGVRKKLKRSRCCVRMGV